MFDWVRGIGVPPAVVGFFRGLVEAVVASVIMAISRELEGPDVPTELEVWVPIIFVALRSLEGVADQLDPKKRRA